MDIGQGGELITSADEIVGKTLYGKVPVPLTRLAQDGAPVVHTVPIGSAVGVVYSYLLPRLPSRTNLWWVFHDEYGRDYYAEHVQGRYNFEALRAQGVLTTEERIQQELEKDKPLEDKVIDAVKYLAIIGIAVFAAVQLVPKLFASSSSH